MIMAMMTKPKFPQTAEELFELQAEWAKLDAQQQVARPAPVSARPTPAAPARSAPAPQPVEDLRQRLALAPKEVARLLGIDTSTYYRNIHGFVMNGQIQSIKVGRVRRILTASLLTWMERQAGQQ